MNHIRSMPLPKVTVTKVPVGTEIALQLENSSDGCIMEKLNHPSIKIELSGKTSQTVIMRLEDLERFLDSPNESAEFLANPA